MDVNINDVEHLSDEDLRSTLMKYGESVGPITSGTRYIWKSKLKKLLKPPLEPEDDVSALTNEINKPAPILQDLKPLASDLYYGIFIPPHFVVDEHEVKRVSIDRAECLSTLKKFQGSRFKSFHSYEEAACFSEYGPITVSIPSTPDNSGAPTFPGTPSVNPENASPYRCPKYQDIVKFRKCVESGDTKKFDEFIEMNPRFLMSSGETPLVLREGPRYNALHLACRNNKPEICRKVLALVSCVEIFQRVYPDDSAECSRRRSAYLLDLYLNTPDKGFNETPLHFAAKEGFADCVALLLSYPGCERAPLNRYGQTPLELNCSRVSSVDESVKSRILGLFEYDFYVPVLRDDTNCQKARIEPPMSPSSPGPGLGRSSPAAASSPLSPSFKVKGYAGPMSPQKAQMFYARWKRTSGVPSPSRGAPPPSPLSGPRTLPPSPLVALRLADPAKGAERVGRNLALEFDVEWREFWPFIDAFVDIASPEGLARLDAHLKTKYKEVVEQQNLEHSDEILRKTRKCTLAGFQTDDAVSFLEKSGVTSDADVTKSSLSSMGELCQNLEALRLNASWSQDPIEPQCKRDGQCWDRVEDCSSKNLTNIFVNNNNAESPGDEANSSIIQYNFAIQSAKISSQRLCSILSDICDSSVHVGPDCSVARRIKSKMKPEIHALRKVLCQLAADFEGGCSGLDLGFVHAFLAAKTSELLAQNVPVSTLVSAFESVKYLKDLIENMEAFVDSSSDDEYETKDYSDGIVETSRHFCCFVKRFSKALKIVTDKAKVAKEDEVVDISHLDGCHCSWSFNSNTNDFNRIRGAKCNGHEAMNEPALNESSYSTRGSAGKYSRAHNFLRRVLFSSQTDSVREGINLEGPDLGTVAKHLDFDEGEPRLRSPQTEDEDAESFASAISSLGENQHMATPDEVVCVYIRGRNPCREDAEVLAVLEDLDVDEKTYPYVYQWLKLVRSAPPDNRKSWRKIEPCLVNAME